MKFFLAFVAIAHVSAQGMENQEHSFSSRTQYSAPTYVPTERLELFRKNLHSLLLECQITGFELCRLVTEALDPTQRENLPTLCDSYQKKSDALQREINDASFNGHPLFGTVWQFGQTHSLPDQKIIVDTGWSRFRELPKQEDEWQNDLNGIVDEVKEILASTHHSKSTFFAFDEAQSIGLTVSPGCGVSVTLPKLNIPLPSTFEEPKNCYNQLKLVSFDITSMVHVLAFVEIIYFPDGNHGKLLAHL